MIWFKNLETRAKLLLSFGMMALLLGVVIVIAYNTVSTIQESERSLYEQEFIGVVNLIDMRAYWDRQRTRVLEVVITRDPDKQRLLQNDIEDRSKQIDEAMIKLAKYYRHEPRFISKIEELKSILAIFRSTRLEVIQLVQTGRIEEAKPIIEGIQAQRYQKIHDIASELEQEMLARAHAQFATSSQVTDRSVSLFALVGMLALLIGLILTVVLSRLISQPLREITMVAERMSAGDLTVELADEQRNDEIGKLIHTFARLAKDLRAQISEMVSGANYLSSAAGEIVSSTSQLAASASQSAAAVSETAITVEEVRQTAQVASQ
ncbi:MAG TPA: methyl-accepting chemotaxis protein, partial [Methylophilaceae bacterium]|nr:methyl-accepting chemotaxis protein [Methylophilaceae bacterium]